MDNKVFKIIRRPIITEKGLGVKETQHTVVFEVSKDHAKGYLSTPKGGGAPASAAAKPAPGN